MDLKRVSIQGNPYPVFFGVYGLNLVMKKHGLKYGKLMERLNSLNDLDNLGSDDFEFIYDVVHAGFATGAKKEGIEFPYEPDDLMIHLDLTAVVTEIFSALADASPQPDESEKKTKAAPKRKAANRQ